MPIRINRCWLARLSIALCLIVFLYCARHYGLFMTYEWQLVAQKISPDRKWVANNYSFAESHGWVTIGYYRVQVIEYGSSAQPYRNILPHEIFFTDSDSAPEPILEWGKDNSLVIRIDENSYRNLSNKNAFDAPVKVEITALGQGHRSLAA
jgi:hypothetical protein